MPQNPNQYIVRAVIPNALDPDLHVLDQAGRYPSVSYPERAQTIEQMLQQIGSQAVGAALSIDRLEDRRNVAMGSGVANIADVVAKPVHPESTALSSGYIWSRDHL